MPSSTVFYIHTRMIEIRSIELLKISSDIGKEIKVSKDKFLV